MESKSPQSTRQRLDELNDLLNSGYVSEKEYHIARTSILREGGFDIVQEKARPEEELPYVGVYSNEPEEEEYEEDEGEEENRRGGFGCLLFLAPILVALLVVGALLAAPVWPARFGGDLVRAMRERALEFWQGEEPVTEQAPTPVSQELASPTPSGPDVFLDVLSPETSSDSQQAGLAKPEGVVSSENLDESPARLPVLRDPADRLLPSPETDEVVVSVSGDVQEIVTGLRGSFTGKSVRMRSTPDTSVKDNIVGLGERGDGFAVEEESADKDGMKWYYIRSDKGGKKGWVNSSLVKIEN